MGASTKRQGAGDGIMMTETMAQRLSTRSTVFRMSQCVAKAAWLSATPRDRGNEQTDLRCTV